MSPSTIYTILLLFIGGLWADKLYQMRNRKYKDLWQDTDQCRRCGVMGFCNYVILPYADSSNIAKFERADFYEERNKEGGDGCRCNDLPNLYFVRRKLFGQNCDEVIDYCELKKVTWCPAGSECIRQPSTYYCSCAQDTYSAMAGQDCSFEIGLFQKLYVHYPPGLIDLLRLPRKFHISGIHFQPAIYIVVRSNSVELKFVYSYEGRYVTVNDHKIYEAESSDDITSRLARLQRAIPHALTPTAYKWLSEQAVAWPSNLRTKMHDLFLDHRMRIELDASDNVRPKNKKYKWRSIGRTAKFNVVIFSKPGDYWLPTHAFYGARVFVPYEQHFLPCSYKITIRVRSVKCSENIDKPTLVAIHRPLELVAGREPWFDNGKGSTSCLMGIFDHRWKFVKTSPGKDVKTDSDPHNHVVDDVQPLSKKFSHGVGGHTKVLDAESFNARIFPSSKLFLMIYDLVQKGHPDAHGTGYEFQQRKLCYLALPKDDKLLVYPVEREEVVECDASYEIHMANDGPAAFPNEDIEVDWKCTYDGGKPCKSVTTSGIQSYMTEKLLCDTVYIFNLTVHYRRNERERAKKSLNQVVFKSKEKATKVDIKCHGYCEHIRTVRDTIKLSATETPRTNSTWKWKVYSVEETTTGLQKTQLSDVEVARRRVPDTEDNVFMMRLTSYFTKEQYTITAETKRGLESYSFRVNQGPPKGECQLLPAHGKKGDPVFTVTCSNWDKGFLPVTYRVVEEYPLSSYPVMSSQDEVMPNLTLYHDNVSVIITDARGAVVITKLTGVKLDSCDQVTAPEFYEYLRRINVKLLGNEDDDALELMGELARKMTATETLYKDDWMLDLLGALSRVDHFHDPMSIQRGLAVANRILDSKKSPGSLKTDQVLIAATEQFITFSDAVGAMMDSGDYTSYDRDRLLPYITKGASLIMSLQDQVVVHDTLEEDDHERHLQRTKHSALAVIDTMGSLAGALERDVNNTLEPYEMSVGGLNLLVTVENLTSMNQRMRETNDLKSFGFSPETLEKYGGAQISLRKLSSNNNSVFWFEPNIAGIMDINLKPTKNESVEIGKEPIYIFFTMSNFTGSKVHFDGVLKPTPRCPSTHKRDRSVSVHQLKLPDGEGVVLMNFPKDLVNKIKVFSTQGTRPDFISVNNRRVLSSTLQHTNFSNLDDVLESDFYVGVIPVVNETVAKPFAFNLSILRCAVWIGEQFEHRDCKFMELQNADTDNPVLVCQCTHQSLFSASFFLPPHKLVLTEDLQLFSTIFDNFYVPLLVFLILLFLIVIILWGYRKDRKDEAERHIYSMEDNYPGDLYPYVIAVFTGERFGSGTSSRVAIRISGDKGLSRVHMLESKKRSVLQLGSDNWFMLKTLKSLGRLETIQLWHNHTGSRPEWYCRRVIVYDITTEQTYEFMVERWFTFDASVPIEEARMFEGTLATDEEISRKWYYHITGWAFSELRDKHHWASIFTRHPRSLYTRCQRAMIAVGLLTTTMLVSMMFFDISTTGPADIPSAGFSIEEFWIGLKSTLISIILTMAVLWCFEKSKQTQIAEIRKLQEGKESTEKKKKLKFIQKMKLKVKKMATKQFQPEPIPYQSVTFGDDESPKKRITVRIFLVVGWTLATCTLIAVSFFIILYGLKFGVKKSLVWMLTFVSGTVSDTLIMEPFKMIVLAVVVSILFRKSNIDNFTMKVKYTPEPETRDTKLEGLRRSFQTRMMSDYHPCQSVWIKQHQKSSCKRETKYLCVYGIFYTLMLMLVGFFLYAIDIQGEFFYLRQIGYHFKEQSNQVITKKSMYQFFRGTAIPGMHRVLWYNNESLPLEKGEKEPNTNKPRFTSDVKGYAQGYTSKLLGVPRLRQIRMRKENLYSLRVDKLFRTRFPKAIGNYLPIREETKSYLPMWKPYDGSQGKIRQLWTFTPPYDTGTILGKSLLPYGGGGYFMFLDWNKGGSLRHLQYLQMNKWVDNYTRSVFLETNFYNNNLKLFSTIRFITEALPCGFFSFRTQLQTASFFFEKKPESKAVVGLMGVLCVLLVGYGLFCFIQFSRVGFVKYMATFRGFCDVILLVIGIVSIAHYLQRALHFSLFIEYLDNAPHDKYISLHTPFQADEAAYNAFGLFTMMLTVSMGVNIVQMISIGRFSWVFSKVYELLIVTIILNTVFNLLLSFLSLSVDRHFYDLFIFQFTFKREKLENYLNGQNRWFFLCCSPIVIGLLKLNLAAVIYFYNTLEKKPTTALAIVHGNKKIEEERTSKKPRTWRSKSKSAPEEKTALQKKIDKLLIK